MQIAAYESQIVSSRPNENEKQKHETRKARLVLNLESQASGPPFQSYPKTEKLTLRSTTQKRE
jgi:hypothetical protein